MLDVKELYTNNLNIKGSDRELIEKAFNFAKAAHEGQERLSGKPYFNHVYATAKNLAELQMDPQTIAAGLLHDTIEDAGVPPEEIEKEFGKEILFLVQGVTKLGKLKYQGLERHAESLRKLFVATAKDIRVILIKLADRLHNMETLEHVRKSKRKRIAQETLRIYAPVAHRLGIGKLKGKLEDLSFPYVHPKKYNDVVALRKQKSKENLERLEKASKKIKKELAEQDIKIIKTDYRIKNLYSLYSKLKKYDMNIDKVYDIAALRIIVEDIPTCYKTLGVIHKAWRPVPGRIKDYIASPKLNGYRSLHTTVFTGNGSIIEIQIRTPDMHLEAQLGVAAHSLYKEKGSVPHQNEYLGWVLKLIEPISSKFDDEKREVKLETPGWINEIIETQKDIDNPKELVNTLETDFFDDRVFVFTPNGDVIDLPIGSTAVDFAYAVHSDIGDHMAGAKINGKLSSIDKKLYTGDIVEIMTKTEAHPTNKWLEHAKTSMAKRRIRAYTSKERKSK